MLVNHVDIVGGGIAAPVLAISLHGRDVSSRIYEQRPKGAHDSGTITLTPNALRILDHLGVYESVRHLGGNFETITIANPRWQVLGRVPMGGERAYGYSTLRIPRQVVRETLLAKAAALGIEVLYGRKCVSVQETSENVRLVFADGEEVESAFVVGADGFKSQLRTQIQPDAKAPEYTGLYNLSGRLAREDLKDLPPDTAFPCSAFGPDNFVSLMPDVYDHAQLSFISSFPFPDKGEEYWATLERNAEERRKLLQEQYCRAPWPEWLQEALARVPGEEVKGWPYQLLPSLPTYLSRHKRVALIGDAAHGMPPTGAQGANSAIEDAQTLAHALASAEKKGKEDEDSSADLEHWDAHRRERVARITAYTMGNEKRLRMTFTPFMQTVREWMMWIMFRFVMPKDGGLAWLYGYRWESMTKD